MTFQVSKKDTARTTPCTSTELSETVTVLMATFNGRTFVESQIASILQQTHTNLTLTILDDYSTDGTYEYLQARYDRDPRITLLRNERNLGVIATFERLLQTVTTEYFALSDQDDVWLPCKIASSLAALRSNPQCLLVYTDLTVVTEHLEEIAASKWKYSNTPGITGKTPIPILIKNPVSGCTVTGRRRLISLALPFPPGIPMHDRWLAAAASAAGGIAALPEATMLYRQHASNDVGGMPFGLTGFRKRIARDAANSYERYFVQRIARRLAIIDALKRMSPHQKQGIEFLQHFYTSRWTRRLLLLPAYAFCLIREARPIGIKNILVDSLLTLYPYDALSSREK